MFRKTHPLTEELRTEDLVCHWDFFMSLNRPFSESVENKVNDAYSFSMENPEGI